MGDRLQTPVTVSLDVRLGMIDQLSSNSSRVHEIPFRKYYWLIRHQKDALLAKHVICSPTSTHVANVVWQ